MSKTEADTLAEWVRFWRHIITPEYRAAFLMGFDPRLLPALFDKLGIVTAADLMAALKEGRGDD